mmetsp:Transcript_137844/g.239587  ORF Transcript_137844/g.239587 Transcript_137844/m.239587 type:complete len:248 (+) Transcript_137844:74-817(+)
MASEKTPFVSDAQLLELSDVQVRHGFVQKVYGILGFQLVLTTLLGGAVMQWGKALVHTNPAAITTLLFGSMAASMAILFVFMCCPDTMRKTPTNYILLTIFTMAESVMVGFICIQYTKESVLIALGLTALIVLSLSIFACQTKYDFTGFGPYLFCGMMCLCGFGFVLMLVSWAGLTGPAFHTARMLYAAGGALLFSMYIVFDTQMIMGGEKTQHRFSVDDYCMAAINLYIDIVQLFLMLLELMGDRK